MSPGFVTADSERWRSQNFGNNGSRQVSSELRRLSLGAHEPRQLIRLDRLTCRTYQGAGPVLDTNSARIRINTRSRNFPTRCPSMAAA